MMPLALRLFLLYGVCVCVRVFLYNFFKKYLLCFHEKYHKNLDRDCIETLVCFGLYEHF